MIIDGDSKGYKKVKYTYCNYFRCNLHGHLHTIDEVDSDDSDFNEHEADDYIDIESSEDSNEDINSSQRNFVTRSQTNAGQQINILTTQNPISISPLNTTQFDLQESEPNSTQNTENSDLFGANGLPSLNDDQEDEDDLEFRQHCFPGVNLVVSYKADSGHACKLIRKKLEELAVRFKKVKMTSYKASGIGGRGNWANEENRKKIEKNVRSCLSQLQLHTEGGGFATNDVDPKHGNQNGPVANFRL